MSLYGGGAGSAQAVWPCAGNSVKISPSGAATGFGPPAWGAAHQKGRQVLKAEELHLYLPEAMRRDAEAGEVNIINRIAAAVTPLGWQLALHGESPAELAKAMGREGRALFHMAQPPVMGGLTLRRAYHYPYWQIEATSARWEFDVAKTVFVPAEIDPVAAKSFASRLRLRVLCDGPVTRNGYVFMPLQGRISRHRSFQSMSPLAMIEATLVAEPQRKIWATLHPKESYDADEMAALAALQSRFQRFRLVQGDAVALLRGCDYVVTQNSGLALSGYLLGKPAVLFARIDFHHIAGSVPRQGVSAAFASAKAGPPDFAGYLYWFFRHHTINGGAQDAEHQIRARFRRHGWIR